MESGKVTKDGSPSLKMAVHTALAKESPGVAVGVDEKGVLLSAAFSRSEARRSSCMAG